jgi:hypothetical protein
MAIFILTVVVGLTGRVKGSLTLPDPMVHFRTSLHETEWTFKKNAIYFAGKHFDSNARAIRTKGNLSIAITLLLVVEIVALIVWLSI